LYLILFFFRRGVVTGALVLTLFIPLLFTVVVCCCWLFVCLLFFLLPAADEYKYVFLAKDTTEQQSALATIALWKTKYPDQPFDLDVLLATMDTRDWKTILGSSKHFQFAARGEQKKWLDYCCRACGCQPCWDRPSDKTMGYRCKCPDMRGKWKKGNIEQITAGGAVEKRSDTKKTESWIKSWKQGTFLAIRRIGPAATKKEMEVRSYSMTYVCGPAKQASKHMPEDQAKGHERIRKGQWYVKVQDMEVVNENNQTWKRIEGQRKERCRAAIFHHVDDIKMHKQRKGVLKVDFGSHCALQTHYAQWLNDDE